MKKHTKVYLQGMGYSETDFIPCEVCGAKAHDIHHIFPRGMGGSKILDVIQNLMALCRKHHDKYGDRDDTREMLVNAHAKAMSKKGVMQISPQTLMKMLLKLKHQAE